MQEELIKKFFEKKCTPEQAEQVAKFLKENPEIAEKFLPKKEWDETSSTLLSDNVRIKVWQNLSNKIRKKAITIPLKQAAVAACISGVIGIGLHLFENSNISPSHHSKTIITKRNDATSREKILANTTEKPLQKILVDGSVVTISPNSVIRYNEPFENNKRDIVLEGEAIFKVAKDKSKPFTVYAGGLATTALGTRFKITSHARQKSITVKLFEGKVVIRSSDENLKGWNKNIYLNAGEQMEYNAEASLVAVTPIPDEKLLKPEIKTLVKPAVANQGMVFSSTPLTEVLDKLSSYYNTKIVYDKKEIDTMNFTGTISKNDSLQMVLKVIAQMNDLSVEQTDSAFIIHNTHQ